VVLMPAFVISEVEILNEPAAKQYRRFAEISIAQYGGRYLVRAEEGRVVEGEKTNRRIVMVEFPSMQRVHEWYASPEYAEALKFRDEALNRRLMFVEGTGQPLL
jgi:uncharacterized protein (DUF1330 family)